MQIYWSDHCCLDFELFQFRFSWDFVRKVGIEAVCVGGPAIEPAGVFPSDMTRVQRRETITARRAEREAIQTAINSPLGLRPISALQLWSCRRSQGGGGGD